MESRGIAYQMVAAFVEQAPAGLLVDIKRWLTRTCGNWGLVDNLAPSVLAPASGQDRQSSDATACASSAIPSASAAIPCSSGGTIAAIRSGDRARSWRGTPFCLPAVTASQ